MWQKIKNILSIIGAVLSVIFFTVVLFLLCRRDSDGRTSNGNNERDSRIQEGLESGQERVGRIEEGIARCEEHLQRAEDILRTAIERSRKENREVEDSSDSD